MLNFDEERVALVEIGNPPIEIQVKISDSLELFDEEISSAFEEKVDKFLGQYQTWMETCINKIQGDGSSGIELISIFILSEQTDDELIFGLEFHTKSDREHGRGIKINAEDLAIIEYGLAEVAFC